MQELAVRDFPHGTESYLIRVQRERGMSEKRAVVIGGGPAGVSAAIYLVRANIPVTLVYRDMGALGKTGAVDNYYGFAETVRGPELFERGISQARRLGVNVVEAEVVGLRWDDHLTALTKDGVYSGDVLVLATGSARIAPRIDGLKAYEGRGVSYCAVCDAFFYRGKDVSVLGNGIYAYHEAKELTATARTVTIYTMGLPAAFENSSDKIRVDSRKVAKILGSESVERLELEDGTIVPMDGVFVAVGVAGSADFARKIGAEVEGVRIVVDENCATTIPGLYACGDCTGGMLQIAKAVYDGAKAAKHAIAYLRSL